MPIASTISAFSFPRCGPIPISTACWRAGRRSRSAREIKQVLADKTQAEPCLDMRRLESDGLREGRGGGVFLTQLQQCQPEIEGDLHGVGRERLRHPKPVGRLGKPPQGMKRRGT